MLFNPSFRLIAAWTAVFLMPLIFSACSESTVSESTSLEESSSSNVESEKALAEKTSQKSTSPEIEKNRPALNLSLNSAPSRESVPGEDFSKKNTLPNLFDKEEKEKKLSVSGKPLRDAANPDYVDSVQGAELSVEIKTP